MNPISHDREEPCRGASGTVGLYHLCSPSQDGALCSKLLWWPVSLGYSASQGSHWPPSVCPMCWCTWGVEVAVMSILLWRLLSGECCPGQGQPCPRHYGDIVQRPPVLRADWTFSDAAGLTGQALMHEPRLSSCCRREDTDLDIWDPLGSKWPFGSLPWFATGVSNSALGPESLRVGDQIYLLSAEKNATGSRKAKGSLTASLWATISVNQSSAMANFKNDLKTLRYLFCY